MQRKSVLLPEPLLPMMAITSFILCCQLRVFGHHIACNRCACGNGLHLTRNEGRICRVVVLITLYIRATGGEFGQLLILNRTTRHTHALAGQIGKAFDAKRFSCKKPPEKTVSKRR